jgi:hypothetical protein
VQRSLRLGRSARVCSISRGFVLCGFLAWGCGGNVTGNGGADASSGADGSGGTTVDGSSDGPSMHASSEAGADVDSGPCMISASNYDQSCNVDTDCWEVSSGDYCSAICRCGTSAINVEALAQFNADVSKNAARIRRPGQRLLLLPFLVGTVLSSRQMRGGKRCVPVSR